MAMRKIESVISKDDCLFVEDVLAAGISKSQLYKYIKQNDLIRVQHGVYAASDAWIDEDYVLHRRCAQAVFSHDTALYYHGLTDMEPLRQTITLPTGYNTKKLSIDGIKVYTIKKELLELGRIIITNDSGHKIPVYDLERTICDILRNRKTLEIQIYTDAIKKYIYRKDKNLSKLMEYGNLFHLTNIIRNYMEVLL